MKKLFLASFTFSTGGNEYKEFRLVVATKKDAEAEERLAPVKCPDRSEYLLNAAYTKAQNWFVKNYPESVWLSTVVYPAIEDYPK